MRRRADAVVELGELGPWRPKLVATDLDGTLLDSAGEVTTRTRAALEACWDASARRVPSAKRAESASVCRETTS